MKDFFKYIIESELIFFARALVKKFKPYVIGVTGSSGKTTVKYMITQMLRASGKEVLGSSSNLNTITGLPMYLLGYKDSPENIFDWIKVAFVVPFKYLSITKYPDYVVCEYAADRPHDIKRLLEIIKPQISVITNIGLAHIEIFKSVEKIAKEKWSLAAATEEKVIVSSTDLKKVEDKVTRADIVLLEKSPINILDKKILPNKTELVVGLYDKKMQVQTKFLGMHNVINIKMALTACYFAGCDFAKMVKSIEKLEPQPGRGKRIAGRREIVVIDESYNANPLSMMAALDNLKHAKYGRRVAVLGQMAEIGPISHRSHQEIAIYARKSSDYVVGVGEKFSDFGLDKWYPSVEELIGDIETLIKRGDIVLVKGSHTVGLEKFVEKLI
jgi:UDP-N-acetylmuramoyl-tripeptide--D-alanyl-D-alanine ligase